MSKLNPHWVSFGVIEPFSLVWGALDLTPYLYMPPSLEKRLDTRAYVIEMKLRNFDERFRDDLYLLFDFCHRVDIAAGQTLFWAGHGFIFQSVGYAQEEAVIRGLLKESGIITTISGHLFSPFEGTKRLEPQTYPEFLAQVRRERANY